MVQDGLAAGRQSMTHGGMTHGGMTDGGMTDGGMASRRMANRALASRAISGLGRLLAAFGVAASLTVAQAQTPAPAAASPLAKVYDCAAIASDPDRLACYDAAVGRLKEAETKGDVVAIDRESVTRIKREAFGFPIPSLPSFVRGAIGGGDDSGQEDAEARGQTMVIERIGKAGDRTAYVFTNGQVWHATEPGALRGAKPGMSITIKPAALGSFLASLEGRNQSQRVRRQR